MTFYSFNYQITSWCRYIRLSLVLVASMFSYKNIFLTLRQHQTRVQLHVHLGQPGHSTHIGRYKNAVSSALWLQLTLVGCYLPFGIADAFMTQVKLSPLVNTVRKFTVSIVFLNSSLNPILYCWKIREARQAVKDTIRQFFC